MSRRARIGAAARRRRSAGGPQAQGREAASVEAWRVIKAEVLARAGWRCQACLLPGRLDVHHVVKRSKGGSDFDRDHLVALCRQCHEQTDAPYAKGRLVVTSIGAGQFTFAIVRRTSKWETSDPAGTGRFAHVGKTVTPGVITAAAAVPAILPTWANDAGHRNDDAHLELGGFAHVGKNHRGAGDA